GPAPEPAGGAAGTSPPQALEPGLGPPRRERPADAPGAGRRDHRPRGAGGPGRSFRQPLTLVASELEIRILNGLTEVARHPRSYDRGQRIEAEDHLAALTAAKPRAHDLRRP